MKFLGLFAWLLPAVLAAELPSDVNGLVAHMARDDFAGKEACEALVKMGTNAVAELLPALKFPQARVRYWSAAALAQIGDERAFAPLQVAAKEDRSTIVRATILWHLPNIKSRQADAYELAVAALADPAPLVRGWALKTLEHGQQRDRLADIVKLTADKDAEVRHDALAAAVKLGGNAQFALIEKLATTDPEAQVREGALRCLTLLPEKKPEILAVMIAALSDKSPEVQATAAKLLAKGANQSFGFDPSRPLDQRARAIAKWREWYEQNKARLRWDDEKRQFVLPAAPVQ
jgi:HEAT repeat protein